MTGSLSLLVLLAFVLFVFPIGLWKVGYDYVIPLRTHKFSLPVELSKFYVFYFFLLSTIFYLSIHFTPYEPNWDLIEIALIPNAAKANTISIKEYFKGETCLFIVVLYTLSFICGLLAGLTDKWRVGQAISHSEDLYSQPIIKLFGLWGAIFNSSAVLRAHVDILTTNDVLYSGRLYYFEMEDGIVSSIAVREAKRFLVSLSDIKGKDEEKYPIPGEITYFYGSQIKNINIRRIEKETHDDLMLSESFVNEKLFLDNLGKLLSEMEPRELKIRTKKKFPIGLSLKKS